MATTTGRGSSVKRRDEAGADEAVQVVRDQVEELARLGPGRCCWRRWRTR
ncbi:MAG: hypothetical protein IPM18_17040 [Phycisphaerales bacterium]|nr:hypothetical protein [Phycisphaerales bacterium]MBK9121289.1 hypothetical protein [Phycisphaerales bacterium]